MLNVLVATQLLASVLVQQPATPPDSLGVVDFPNSGAEEAQTAFLEGVRLLHSFEYRSAAQAFRSAQKTDPSFSLAYWGEAMTHFHLLWQEEDVPAARAALDQLAPTQSARRSLAPTERERLYLTAVEQLAGDGRKPERLAAYERALGELVRNYPADLEAKALHALAILGTRDGVRDVPTYMRAAAVAEEVFAAQPRHPGAAHYLIHAYDDPVHAPLGLRAARVYAEIAPAAPHALHMPSHVFLALGRWEDVVASNRESAAAARAQLDAGNRDGLGTRDHALQWLSYALLQLDRPDEALEVHRFLARAAETTGESNTRWHAMMTRAAYLVDAPAPDPAMISAALNAPDDRGSVSVASLFAAAYAARELDRQELASPDSNATTPNEDDGDAARVMRLELAALAAANAGNLDSAIGLAEEAARLEDAMPIEFGPPVVVKPAAELLGELLLEAGDRERAAAAFRRSLRRTPNRTTAVEGLARVERVAPRSAPMRNPSVEIGEIVLNRGDFGTWAHYVPTDPRGILVLAHGYPWPDDSRTAAQLEEHVLEYAERWRSYADTTRLALLVPAFGSGDFAGYRQLFGKRLDADKFVLALVDRYGESLVPEFDGRFHLYGHSAGGQFAGRFLVQHPDRLAGVVLSAPSTYPYPEADVAWPYGMAPVVRDSLSGSASFGKPADQAQGATFLSDSDGWAAAASTVPVRIVIGGDDDVPRSEHPGQRGNTRIDRALGWVEAMNDLALSRGDTGTVAVRFVPGVDHDPVALTAPAQRLLTLMLDGRRETALDSVAWLAGTLAPEVPDVPRPDQAGSSRIRPVSVRGVDLFVRERGAGTPIVLIPGGPGNTQQSFHPFFDEAAAFAHVIYYDPRGTGDSDWTPGPAGYSADQSVEDLDALRTALGIERWIVHGWSFGGLLAQRYALRYPERIAGLVLVSSSVPVDVETGESDGRWYMSAAERSRVREVYRDGVRTVVPVHSDDVDLATVRHLVYNAYLNGEWKRQFFYRPSFERIAQVARWEWRHDRNYTAPVNSTGFAHDLTGSFLDWTTPTLIIEGEWDPGWGPAKLGVLREQFPHAEVHVLDRASHNSFAERPDRFFALLEQFVRRVETEQEATGQWKQK